VGEAKAFVRSLAGEHVETKEEKIKKLERGLLGIIRRLLPTHRSSPPRRPRRRR